MKFLTTKIPGLIIIEPNIFEDKRGFFFECYHADKFKEGGILDSFLQDNHSKSAQGTLRGLHYQLNPNAQAKLVRVISGEIFDVAVDIRPDSPTFGRWRGVILDGHSHHQLFIPVGFAHGFCVLSEEAHVLYKVSTPYDSLYEKGFRWDDPTLNIQWPVENPIVSERDRQAPEFKISIQTV